MKRKIIPEINDYCLQKALSGLLLKAARGMADLEELSGERSIEAIREAVQAFVLAFPIWTSVKHKLPDAERLVLINCERRSSSLPPCVSLGLLMDGRWVEVSEDAEGENRFMQGLEVTHWMECPVPVQSRNGGRFGY